MLVNDLLKDLNHVLNPVLPVQTSAVNTELEETRLNEAEGGFSAALSTGSGQTPTPPGFHFSEAIQQHPGESQQQIQPQPQVSDELFQAKQLQTLLDQQREQIHMELKKHENLKLQQQEINRFGLAQATQPPISTVQQQQQQDLLEQQQQLIRQLRIRNQQLEQANQQLQRQTMQQQQQAPYREEPVRRIPKGIHNWPFKFRGQQDTTSLNVFLDRVEAFASSENLDQETLLANIKHLLEKTAQDWYTRAFVEGRLTSWEEFKREIRKEFLPGSYSQILRLEASYRFQGQNESFADFHRDISMLFRFITPPISEEDKIFIMKKNMCVDYAIIVAAANPTSVAELVKICSSYDDTRRLLNCQRKIPFPHNSLLEPSFATPSLQQRTGIASTNQRYSRVNVVEEDDSRSVTEAVQQPESEDLLAKIEELEQQVCAFKMQLNKQRREAPSMGPRAPQQARPFQRQQEHQFNPQRRQETGYQHFAVQPPESATYRTQSNEQIAYPQRQFPGRFSQLPTQQEDRQNAAESLPQQQPTVSGPLLKVCWNCDEEGHRFMDCSRPQAILFCYRCGRKGYSLRSCFTCRTDSGNPLAENRQ
ncbi:uncharacterized protein LOC129759817 [Uranotaenia lowii]|uniref:uncharacterized protein LOC129759817 n=1 Tax=Uranotaenia lowii TaxID=190385 RepID=UPI0024793E9C|nr:uncharacterized protein LOC129759817 [Uranotaenia lowii]